MKVLFLISTLCMIVSPALAAKINEATCSEITSKSSKNVTPQYIAESEGFNANGKEVFDEIDTTDIMSHAQQVDAQCSKDLSTKLSSISTKPLKRITKDNKKFKINPLKAKCEDFVALDEEVKPIAVYWVAGYDKSGKLKNNGEFDEVFLEQPVVDLAKDCIAHPKESFYARTKAWVKKHV